MNARERFLTALRGGTPDRVPVYEFHWNPGFMQEVLGRPVGAHNVDDEVEMSRRTGIEMVWTPAYGFTALLNCQMEVADEHYRDDWGTQYGTNEHAWPAGWPEDFAVNSREAWERLTPPDSSDAKHTAQARRAVELSRGDLAVLGGVRGPFSAVWMLTGLVNIGLMLYEDPDLLQDMFRVLGQWNTELGLGLIKAGVDVVVVNDDYGMNNQTFISPADWRRMVLPVVAEEIETLAAAGVPVILHSDGNLNAILDDITHLRIAGLHPLQRSAKMDIAAVKQKYGDRLCLLGNLSVTTTLPYGTPDQVALEALECLAVAAPGGGYILAADHSFHGGVPSANVWRALDTCRQFGQYPLDLAAIQAERTRLQQPVEAAT